MAELDGPPYIGGGGVYNILLSNENPSVIDSVNFSVFFDRDETLSAYCLSSLSFCSTKRFLIWISSWAQATI